MSKKLLTTNVLSWFNNYIHIGDLQIVFMHGNIDTGNTKAVYFPQAFVDNNIVIIANGNWESTVKINNIYKDVVYFNVSNSNSKTTSVYHFIAIGKYK